MMGDRDQGLGKEAQKSMCHCMHELYRWVMMRFAAASMPVVSVCQVLVKRTAEREAVRKSDMKMPDKHSSKAERDTWRLREEREVCVRNCLARMCPQNDSLAEFSCLMVTGFLGKNGIAPLRSA